MSLEKTHRHVPPADSLPTDGSDHADPASNPDRPPVRPPQAPAPDPGDKPKRKRRPRFVLRSRCAAAASSSTWRMKPAAPPA